MDLPQIGAHCALETCNVCDFLPITCKCQKKFCRDHIFPDNHGCTAVAEAQTASATTASGPPLKRCTLEGCQKPSLYAFTNDPERESCEKCHGSFCVQHRYPDTHNCAPIQDPTPGPESSARALLKKNFGSQMTGGGTSKPKSSTRKKKPPTDPVKLAQWKKVELMKLRHRAVPADPKDKGTSPPVDQRLAVSVLYDGEEKPFWLRKSVSGGKAIDMLSTQMKVRGSNSTVRVFVGC
ncbi:hypothetical protein CC2G_005942 [Coprinopsis cinerea AmutBmut pab1-1]|nr:hypothetical protein CC2G_005942 [Coprinopsis cinerea AmutBmut pab1-1]